MSIPVNNLWFLNICRISRFALFRFTALPIFRLAAMPRRGKPSSFDRAKQVMNRPRSRVPRSYTRVNSARRRNLSLDMPSAGHQGAGAGLEPR